jgi:hypothetical protein
MLCISKFDCKNHKGITQFQKILQEKTISFIIERRLQSSLRSTILMNCRPETFKGRKLKIVQTSEQTKTRIFRDMKFSLFEHVLDKKIGDNGWE